MTFGRASLVAVTLLSFAVAAEAPANVLEQLALALSTVRSSASVEPVQAGGPLPDLKGLVGIDQSLLFSRLGRPDGCVSGNVVAPCSELPEWTYDFFRLPPNWRGGGPTLTLSFNEELRVRSAAWRYSR